MSFALDPHLKDFTKKLDFAIQVYGEAPDGAEEFIDRQREQVAALDGLEDEFRLSLQQLPQGEAVYEAFIGHIRDVKRNILDARPYFRERQTTFTAEISHALHSRTATDLYPYHFNFNFVLFALGAHKWRKGSRLVRLGKAVGAARTQLIETNAPLAIAQASKFYRKTPRSHLSRMDLIQIALEGLTAGIDKYSGQYNNTLYRQVLIGRIVGNLIEAYSETMVHFYPSDKRKLYNANKALRVFSDDTVDYDALARHINDTAKQVHYRTTPDEIAGLVAASSLVSADTPRDVAEGEESSTAMKQAADDESRRPDEQYEHTEVYAAVHKAISQLSVLERKVLKLRGVDIALPQFR